MCYFYSMEIWHHWFLTVHCARWIRTPNYFAISLFRSARVPFDIVARRPLVGRNSSVGRALDWRSKGPWFNPGFRQRGRTIRRPTHLFVLCTLSRSMIEVRISAMDNLGIGLIRSPPPRYPIPFNLDMHTHTYVCICCELFIAWNIQWLHI